MWCPQCHVAFSYKTLKIDTGNIHNPEYYKYLQQTNNGIAPRNPQDILCGGLCNMNQLHRSISNNIDYKLKNFQDLYLKVSRTHRAINHITNNELVRTRQTVRNISNTEKLRVYYILGQKDGKEYNKDNLMQDIYKNDIKRKKLTKILHVYELLTVFGIEIFNEFLNHPKNNSIFNLIENKLNEITNLKNYCNNEFAKISNTYNSTTLFISDTWQISYKKYKLSDIESY
tara:strand:- start:461 stop:1147 length:687 start_codon:yes stop_codon:yes gene_type:complete